MMAPFGEADESLRVVRSHGGWGAVVTLQEVSNWQPDAEADIAGPEQRHNRGSRVAMLWPIRDGPPLFKRLCGTARACAMPFRGLVVSGRCLPDDGSLHPIE